MGRKLKGLPKQSALWLAVERPRGSILIITLWSLCLLTTFIVILGYEVRQKLTLVSRLEERDKLRYIVEAGIKKAIVELRKEPLKAYDSLKDGWSNNTGAFCGIDIGDGKADIVYDYLDEVSGLKEVRYGFTDEERKININKADAPVLERLFHIVLGFDDLRAQELAASIIDWRDADSELSIPLGSGEDSYYRNLQYPYEAKDAGFEVLDEVLLVKDMDRDIFEKIKDYITIYGGGKININTASGCVLLALGLSEDITAGILSFRTGEDGVTGTYDDNAFDDPVNIVPKLSQSCNLSDADISQLSMIRDQYLVTNSNNFTARCAAKLNTEVNNSVLTCVVNRGGKILYWQES